jgi:2-polyprenyl-6-methoxyphenol hydroxylase-like FAD-dependent oxidoreductase
MRIRIIGAGPAGLYFAALMKQRDRSHEILVFERNPRAATFGFGVVFSDRALEFLRADDEALYQYLTPHLERWPNITVAHNDTAIPIAGNGFTSIGRLELLTLLYEYVERLGVELVFEREVTIVRRARRSGPGRRCQRRLFVGQGPRTSSASARRSIGGRTSSSGTAARRLSTALTLDLSRDGRGRVLRPSLSLPAGSQHVPGRSDAEGTWDNAGFATMGADDTIAHCERVFAHELAGERILSNQSQWRQFPAIWNDRWSFDNVVLLGDALRTAHFSIGSGTRLAMEDAVALFKAFAAAGDGDIPGALALYQQQRLPPMRKIWDAANASLRWYEDMDRLVRLALPVEFAYSYMTRTGRVDHAEVRRRDPRLAAAYEALHPEAAD